MVSAMSQKPGTAHAVAAAQAVAIGNSVSCEDAVVVTGGSNVLVHLKPAPVVARGMTSTAALHVDVESWLARKVAVGAFLSERGAGRARAAQRHPRLARWASRPVAPIADSHAA
jgi:hypothetical protein